MSTKLTLLALVTSLLAGAPRAPSSTVGSPVSFSVRITGHGRPMVLIPGLACSGAVWDDLVRRYADRYELHVITIAGFGGEPARPGVTLETVRTELARYLRAAGATGAARSIVVGHSLGATMAFALAEEHPELVAGVVAVDGVPYLPALTDAAASPEEQADAAGKLVASIEAMSPEDFSAAGRATATTSVRDPAQVDRIASWEAHSDRRMVASALASLMTHDYRSEAGQISAPVVLVAASSWVHTEPDLAAVRASYEAQVAAIPDHRVVLARHARHFVMLDEPAVLYASLDELAARVPTVARPGARP